MERAGDPGARLSGPEGDRPQDPHRRRVAPTAAGVGIACAVLFSLLALYGLYAGDPRHLLAALPPLIPSLLFYFAGIFLLTLSPGLSLIASGALALCILWSLGLLALARVDLDPPVVVAVLAVNAANALLIAQLVYAVLVDACRDMELGAAVGKNLRRWTVPGAIAVAAMLIPILALAPLEGEWVVAASIAALGSVLASTPVNFIALPYLLDRMPIAEPVIARANIWREWRETYLLAFGAIASPRWAYAICGAVAVLFAVFLFDGGRVAILADGTIADAWRAGGAALALSLCAVAALAALALRDWRFAIVPAVVPFVFASWGAWLIVSVQIAAPAAAATLLVLGTGFGAGIAILLLDAIGVYRRFEDDAVGALARAFYDSGAVIGIVGIALAASAAIFATRFPQAAGGGLMILVQALGVAIVSPCLAAILEDIFPKRKSLEELYGGR